MSDNRFAHDDGQLPWLQAVDDEDEPRGVSARKMLAALLVVLLAAAIIAGSFFWLGQRDAATGGGTQLIRAEAGPYKIRPADPGGLDVAGESETAFQTSAGEDRDSRLDLSAMADRPTRPPEAESDADAPAAAPEPAPEPAPQAPSGAPGSVIQVGAFQNRAQAERAWTALTNRFPAVSAMTKMVVPFSGGIRLRAAASSPAEAAEACRTLKAAGENCFVAR